MEKTIGTIRDLYERKLEIAADLSRYKVCAYGAIFVENPTFSPAQARELAALLVKAAGEVEGKS